MKTPSSDRFGTDLAAASDYVWRNYQEGRGEIKAVETPWKGTDWLIGGGLRLGEISVVAGPGGNGKTNFALNLIIRMAAQNRPAIYMPLEDKAWEIMRRVSSILHDDWSLMNECKSEDQASAIEEAVLAGKHSELFIKIARDYVMKNPKDAVVDDTGNVYAPRLKPSELLEWLNGEQARNQELVIIDPMSMVNFRADGGKDYEAQEEFVQDCHAIAEHHGYHLMMLAHIRKRQRYQNKQQDLCIDDIQGSAAFNRHTRYALLLDYHHEYRTSDLSTGNTCNHKHTLLLAKANYGKGTGQKLAFTYSGNGPQFVEHGVITG